MSLLDWAMQIVAAEEAAWHQERKQTLAAQPPETPPPAQPRTKILIRETVGLPSKILDEIGSGRLREISIKCSSPDFWISISIDDDQVFAESWGWYEKIGEEVDGVDAFFDDEQELYVLHLSDLCFTKRLMVEGRALDPAANLHLEQVVCKLELTAL